MKKKKKAIIKLREQSQETLPSVPIVIEPETSQKKLLELERAYGLNTRDVFDEKEWTMHLSPSVREAWCDLFRIFCAMKGNESNLNTQKEKGK